MLCVAATACKAPKDIAYFQDLQENMVAMPSAVQQIRIEPGDKLMITVKTADPALSALFNLQVVTDRSSQETAPSSTNYMSKSYSSQADGIARYTVTPQGEIDFPVLGMLHVAGLTRSECAAFIKGDLMGRNLVKDPVVTVEFLNTGVAVLGEVKNPGRFDVNQDKISLLEAISYAGDLNITGKRDNISVIREEGDGIHTYRVDITNFSELSKSPAYYLKQGDIVYVEPNNVKKNQATVNGNNVLSASFWISVASLLSSVAVLIFK